MKDNAIHMLSFSGHKFHAPKGMGVPYTMAHGSVRFSLSIYNTEEEIAFVIEKLPPIIERLREMSPYWSAQSTVCASM